MAGAARIAVASLFAVLTGLSGCATHYQQNPAQESVAFGVIGDLAYDPSYEPQLERVLADLNAARLAFVVHLGDLASPRYACADDVRARRLAQFQASEHPLIYTPGDNEWTDCHEAQGVKGHDPEERLADLRQRFFPGPNTLGRRTFPVIRQSDDKDPATAPYRENVRWSMHDVTYLTIHTVGSNNNRGRTAAADAEYARRTEANLKWLRDGFRHAKAGNARAVVIFTQANMIYELTPVGGGKEENPSGFADIRAALEQETVAFGRPVVLIHGDTHYFRVDKPLGRGTAKQRLPSLENFTRVEAFGQPNHHWLRVTVEPDDPSVFTFRQRIVPANVLDRGPASPK